MLQRYECGGGLAVISDGFGVNQEMVRRHLSVERCRSGCGFTYAMASERSGSAAATGSGLQVGH